MSTSQVKFNGLDYTVSTDKNVTKLNRVNRRGVAVSVYLLDAIVIAGRVSAYSLRSDNQGGIYY